MSHRAVFSRRFAQESKRMSSRYHDCILGISEGMLCTKLMQSSGQFARVLTRVVWCILLCLSAPLAPRGQEPAKGTSGRPTELEATDPEIRQLLDGTRSTCEQFNIVDTIARVQAALKLADSRGLIGDRALAQAILASAYIGQAKAFTISRIPLSSNAAGCGYPSANGMALGATGVQPPLDSGIIPEPSQGRIVLPFRPACAS